MTLYDVAMYVLAGLGASLAVSAVAAAVALAYGWWQARRDFAEVDRIVGDVPRVPQERDRA